MGLTLATRALCLVAFLTGGADLLDGQALLASAGTRLGAAAADPVLNSEIRFWGAIWFGFGLILWRASSRFTTDPGLFRLLCGIVLASGVGRLVSAIQYGLPGTILTGAMGLELLGGAGLLLWHAAELRRPHAAPV